MRIKDIRAFRQQLQQDLNHTGAGWDAHFMGSRTSLAGGGEAFGFFNFFQGGTGQGRKAIEGKLRGVLEMAQNDQAIYEITQNAADCASTDLQLWYDDAHFLAFNNGTAFSTADVKSILDTFASEKSDRQRAGNEGMIGQYGVGFKLFHRLVGRESGLEELLDRYSGPMVFSWTTAEQLRTFLTERTETIMSGPDEGNTPWFYKILLTCFPCAPGELVYDIDHQERIPFTQAEAALFRQWAAERLTSSSVDLPEQGSLFFLALGEGKRQVLDAHMAEIRSCMAISLNFLRDLRSITVNGERIERLELERIDLHVPKSELRALGFKEDEQDLTITMAWSEEATERLLKEPTLYQYFPMTKEVHGMAYVIHSNGLQKQAQRTELNADSAINARLLERLTSRVKEQAQEWMKSDPDRYRAFFKVILSSAFEPSRLKVLHEQVQRPLIEFVRAHVPTMEGGFASRDHVRIRRSKLPIPASVLGEGQHWFHWTKDMDEAVLVHARNSARLNLQESTIGSLLTEKEAVDGLFPWIADLRDEAYVECLKEFAVLKLDPAKYRELPFLRADQRTCSLNEVLAEPALLEKAKDWHQAYPDAGEWLPTQALEQALSGLAETTWGGSTTDLLYRLHDDKAMMTLVERIPKILLDNGPTAEVQAFMDWWYHIRDRPASQLLRKRLVMLSGDEELAWEESLVLERFKIRLPSEKEVELPIQRLLPALAPTGLERFDALRDALLDLGYDSDFLAEVFRRNKEKSKQDLQRIGDSLAEGYTDKPLDNGSQLIFAIALKHLHPAWTGFEELELLAADDQSYGMEEWWALTGPSFIDRQFLLHDRYKVVAQYLGEHWDPIKFGSKGVLAAEPRLGEAFMPELAAPELDDVQRRSFLDWLMKERNRNETALYGLQPVEYRPMLEGVFGTHPANWVLGPDALLLPEEKPPAWVLEWAGDEVARMAMLHSLGLRSADDNVLQWREALLNDTEECAAQLPSSPDQTLRWIIVNGGSETFVSSRQERRITDLIHSKGGAPGTALRLDLELRARESEDHVYVAWRSEGHGWTVLEYEGEQLPLDITWEGSALAMRHAMKAFAPTDGSQRIFITAGYPIMVALYLLSDGAGATITAAVRESFRMLHDRVHSGTKKEATPRERSVEALERKQQVEHFRERQFMLSKTSDITLDEVVNVVEWEYRRKLLDREGGHAFRFKEVEQLPDGVLVLRRPNVAELPYDLTSDRDRTIHGMKLKLRKPGSAYQDITDYLLLAGTEGEVRIRVKDLPFALNESTVAMIELPVEDMLSRTLAEAWRRIAQAHEPSRPIIDLIKEQAPGGHVGFIFGPPGTGKTTVLADRLIQSVRNTEAKVLVLTPTNTAADVLYERISEKASGDMKVLQGVHRFGAQNKDIPLSEGYPAVVITTMHRFTFDRFANGTGLNDVDWDHVVFDEASMVALPYALLPLLSLPANRSASEWGALGARFLFAGDPFQLMPVAATPSMGDRLEAEKKDIVLRGFATENIFTLAGIDRFSMEESPALPGARIDRLVTNYRSGRSIVKAFSRTFYEDGVTSARNNDDHAITLGSELLPSIGLWSFPALVPEKGAPADDMLNPATIIPIEHSAVHVHSALLATRLAVLLATENPGKRVIIICPYVRQVRLCQTLLEPFNKDKSEDPPQNEGKPVEVSSVHRYQGGEAEVVIFLLNPSASSTREDGRLVIGEIALFNDPHLINVAISRARDVLVLLAPENEAVSRTGRSGFFLMDRVLDGKAEDAVQVNGRPSKELEELLFNGQALEERVSVLPIRAMDVYRVKEKRDRGNDLVVLHNKENLNMVMAEDLVMEGVAMIAGKARPYIP